MEKDVLEQYHIFLDICKNLENDLVKFNQIQNKLASRLLLGQLTDVEKNNILIQMDKNQEAKQHYLSKIYEMRTSFEKNAANIVYTSEYQKETYQSYIEKIIFLFDELEKFHDINMKPNI